MTDAGKKALENIKLWVEFEEHAEANLKSFWTVLNLIKKQDEIIHEMAKSILNGGLKWENEGDLIEYFEKKASE